MKKIFLILLQYILVQSLFAQTDVKGSKDHPVVSRFNGSWIRFYDVNKFGQYKLRVSPIKKGTENTAQKKTLEGTITRIIYQCTRTVSSLELYKSYETALLNNGFQKIYSCETTGCGDGFGRDFPDDNAPHIKSYSQDQYYFAGRRDEDDSTEIYVSVYTVFTQDGPVARLDLVEIKKMAEGQVKVTAAKIKSDFEKTGKAVINQVYFETGKASLQKESDPALTEVSKFLRENPTLKIFVVGHTDDEGGFEFNMTLSRQRSETIVKELTTKYGIESNRLNAEGVGYLCPVATNKNAAGKAKNRRVELVLQ